MYTPLLQRSKLQPSVSATYRIQDHSGSCRNDGVGHDRTILTWGNVLDLWKARNAAFNVCFAGILRNSGFQDFYWECSPVSESALDEAFEFSLRNAQGSLLSVPASGRSFKEHFERAEKNCSMPSVVNFQNLGGDAMLVVPTHQHSTYLPQSQVHGRSPRGAQNRQGYKGGSPREDTTGSDDPWGAGPEPNAWQKKLRRKSTPAKPANKNIYGHLASFVRDAPAEQQLDLWQRVGDVVLDDIKRNPLETRWVSTDGRGVPWLHVRVDVSPKYYKHSTYKAPRRTAGHHREPPQGAITGIYHRERSQGDITGSHHTAPSWPWSRHTREQEHQPPAAGQYNHDSVAVDQYESDYARAANEQRFSQDTEAWRPAGGRARSRRGSLQEEPLPGTTRGASSTPREEELASRAATSTGSMGMDSPRCWPLKAGGRAPPKRPLAEEPGVPPNQVYQPINNECMATKTRDSGESADTTLTATQHQECAEPASQAQADEQLQLGPQQQCFEDLTDANCAKLRSRFCDEHVASKKASQGLQAEPLASEGLHDCTMADAVPL